MIKVVTDSTSDLSEALKERWGIASVPLYVLFGGQMLRDGIDITTRELFKGIKEGQKTPSTSQPSPTEFAAVYEQALQSASEVLSVHISGALSGTVGSARLAAQDFGGRVTVLDSGSVSMGLGLRALRAAERAEAGNSMAQIVLELEKVRAQADIRFTVETLEFLKLNGRIGGAAALLGGLLNFKPILAVQAGKVAPIARERGQKKATANLVASGRAYLEQHGPSRVAFVSTEGGEAGAEELRQGLGGLPFEDIGNFNFGAVVGTHAGPGTYGVVMEPQRV